MRSLFIIGLGILLAILVAGVTLLKSAEKKGRKTGIDKYV